MKSCPKRGNINYHGVPVLAYGRNYQGNFAAVKIAKPPSINKLNS